MAEKKPRAPRGEGSIRWRDEAKTVAQIRFVSGRDANGKPVRECETFRATAPTANGRVNQARTRRNEILAKIKDGGWARKTRVTVAEYLREHLALEKPMLARRTHHRYCDLIERNALGVGENGKLGVAPHIGRLALQELTPRHLSALYSHLRENGRADGKGGLSGASVRQLGFVISKACKRAVRENTLKFNPANGVKLPKQVLPELPYPTASETDAIIEYMRVNATTLQASNLYVAALLCGYGAERRGEALASRWTELEEQSDGSVAISIARSLQQDPEKGSVPYFKSTKSGESRDVTVDEDVAAALRTHRALQNEARLRAGSAWQDQGLIIARADGSPYPPQTFSYDFIKAVKLAKAALGIPASKKLNIKSFRHSALTRFLSEGADSMTVMSIAGHSDLKTTERYLHKDRANQVRAANRMAESRRKNLATGLGGERSGQLVAKTETA